MRARSSSLAAPTIWTVVARISDGSRKPSMAASSVAISVALSFVPLVLMRAGVARSETKAAKTFRRGVDDPDLVVSDLRHREGAVIGAVCAQPPDAAGPDEP